MDYNSDYDIRLATLEAMGGDATKCYDSVYEIDLAILDIIQHGGGGGTIDDNNVSTGTTWSSSKITAELADAGFDIEIVTELPAEGDAHTIYFIESDDPSTGNLYEEWMYIGSDWELVGTTGIDLSAYATLDDISTFAAIDDNNVSTGTTYSSHMIEGDYYMDITNMIDGSINMWALQQYAKTLTTSESATVYLRDDNLYFTVESFPLSAELTYTIGGETTDYVSNKIVFYNTVNQNLEITNDGRYLEIYVCYYDNTISDNSGKIYAYWPMGEMVDHCDSGTNYGEQYWMMHLQWYGWDGLNNPSRGSDQWGYFRYEAKGAYDMNQKFNTANYGSRIEITGANTTINNCFTLRPIVHNGGFLKNLGTVSPYTPDPYNAYHIFETAYDDNGQAIEPVAVAQNCKLTLNGESELKYCEPFSDNIANDYGNIYVPTTSGTAGQYLVSGGNGAPTWQDLEVASDYVISDADASAGIYSEDVSNFYAKTIDESIMQGVQIKITDEHLVNNVSVYSDSYYLPSASRIYENNVELWLMYTEDGATWENRHYLITDSSISLDISTGIFGQPTV